MTNKEIDNIKIELKTRDDAALEKLARNLETQLAFANNSTIYLLVRGEQRYRKVNLMNNVTIKEL